MHGKYNQCLYSQCFFAKNHPLKEKDQVRSSYLPNGHLYSCLCLLGMSFLPVGIDARIISSQPLGRARLIAGQPKQLWVIRVAGFWVNSEQL